MVCIGEFDRILSKRNKQEQGKKCSFYCFNNSIQVLNMKTTMNTNIPNYAIDNLKNSGSVWKREDEIEENSIGLSRNISSQLIHDLDTHCSSLFVLFHQYQKHHWLVEGPQFMSLHLFLEKNYKEVHSQVDEIAERITILGGIPASSPFALMNKAYIEHEEEGMFHIREMLELDLKHERKITLNLCKTIQKANELGDYGTRHLLEKILYATENRAHHLDHFLGEDSLVLKQVTKHITE